MTVSRIIYIRKLQVQSLSGADVYAASEMPVTSWEETDEQRLLSESLLQASLNFSANSQVKLKQVAKFCVYVTSALLKTINK